ncbi:hypothetical protein Pelo_17002 [Pelomyxa schiedti]|nr:hypothetical protein Pelo_17002 [Pelomyxa schiedti]
MERGAWELMKAYLQLNWSQEDVRAVIQVCHEFRVLISESLIFDSVKSMNGLSFVIVGVTSYIIEDNKKWALCAKYPFLVVSEWLSSIPERGSDNLPCVPLVLSLFSDKIEQTSKKSIGTLLCTIRNLPVKIAEMPVASVVLSTKIDSQQQFYNVLDLLIPTLIQLNTVGVPIWSAFHGQLVRLYARLVLFTADGQMRWMAAGVNPPSGNLSAYWCQTCEIPCAGFHSDYQAPKRNLQYCIEQCKIASQAPNESQAYLIMHRCHLHKNAFANPLLAYAEKLSFNPFVQVPGDILHVFLLNLAKKIAKTLQEKLTSDAVHLIEQRSQLIHNYWKAQGICIPLPNLTAIKQWNGKDVLKFLSLAPITLQQLPDLHEEYALCICSLVKLVFLVKSPFWCTSFNLICNKTFKKFKKLCFMLFGSLFDNSINIHLPVHFCQWIEAFGPPFCFDTQSGERLQQEVGLVGKHFVGKDAQHILLRCSAKTCLSIVELHRNRSLLPSSEISYFEQSQAVVVRGLTIRIGDVYLCAKPSSPARADFQFAFGRICGIHWNQGFVDVAWITDPTRNIKTKVLLCEPTTAQTLSLHSILRHTVIMPEFQTNSTTLAHTQFIWPSLLLAL